MNNHIHPYSRLLNQKENIGEIDGVPGKAGKGNVVANYADEDQEGCGVNKHACKQEEVPSRGHAVGDTLELIVKLKKEKVIDGEKSKGNQVRQAHL